METVYNKLRRMESLLNTIPENVRIMYKFETFHTPGDFVGFKFHTSEHGYVGCSADADVKISYSEVSNTLTIRNGSIDITLYGSAPFPMSHTFIFSKL